ncbi:MAG TPA: recombination mediator RecR [Patescibacteria group bacterium]|jgi:recombination protein RecR|nr:recombination mediator RecR [Patescibacteria group bacterium]
MLKLPSSLERVINEFGKLPGIGPKSAQRLAFYLLKKDAVEINGLSDSIRALKSDITFCSQCHNMAETDPCSICADQSRDHTLICVVEEPLDAIAIDKTGQYKGVFHILGGVLNPMEGIGPEQLNIGSLQKRVLDLGAKEIIIATNPTLEGETTAMHIAKALGGMEIRITRIARGLPMGGDLEYADEITLSRAMEGRRDF